MPEHTYTLNCWHCYEPIHPDAQWPDTEVWDDDLSFHDGCLDGYRIDRAKEFQRSIEELAVNPTFQQNHYEDQRRRHELARRREYAVCNCEQEAGEIPCPVHHGSGRWAR